VAGGHNLLMIGPPGKALIYYVRFWREVRVCMAMIESQLTI